MSKKPLTDEHAKTYPRKRLTTAQLARRRELYSLKTKTPEQIAKRKLYDMLPEVMERKRLRSHEAGGSRLTRIGANNHLCLDRLKTGCIECGESDILVLEFDHLDEYSKTSGISQLRKTGLTAKLVEELHKCVVLCANCHKRRTAKQFGSWRLEHSVTTPLV
jgi:hypothetical protein